MSRIIVWLCVSLAVLYLLLCIALFVFQRSLIYFPQPRSTGEEASLLELPIEGGEVLVSTRARDSRNALLYFGGNAEDVSLNLPDFAEVFPEHALYLMHYRGYGGSDGSPTEEALYRDAFALFDRVRSEHDCILVMGRSLGTGVAIRLASGRPVSRLILVTPFYSLESLAARQFPFVPVGWLLKDSYPAWQYAAQLRVPTLLIAAEDDEVVPQASTESLLEGFPEGVASLRVIPGAGHNSISRDDGYQALLQSWACPAS